MKVTHLSIHKTKLIDPKKSYTVHVKRKKSVFQWAQLDFCTINSFFFAIKREKRLTLILELCINPLLQGLSQLSIFKIGLLFCIVINAQMCKIVNANFLKLFFKLYW